MRKIVYMFLQDQSPNWFRPAVPVDYPVDYWDPDCTYDADTIFYYDMYGPYHNTIQTHLDRGHCVIFDAKNEHYVHYGLHWVFVLMLQHPGQGTIIVSGDSAKIIPGVKIIATPYWYWITTQSALHAFELDQYQPQSPGVKKKFFMSIGLHRPERDYLYDSLGDLLEDSIHSYRHRGVFLPDDCSMTLQNAVPLTLKDAWQRYINTDWMDSTVFTLAVETYIDDCAFTGYSLTENDRFFLSEKSYKPMACKHPILMVSTSGNLAHLRSQGFETFPELWDETYDDITDWRERIDRIVQIVRDFDHRLLDNPAIKEKLLYNSARFFDQDLTKKLLNTSIVEPVLEFVNA